MSTSQLSNPESVDTSPAIASPGLGAIIWDAFAKLAPATQWKNPVMFVVYLGSILTTVLGVQALRGHADAPAGFVWAIAGWLWFTVLFANAAEALAEGRGKAQAEALRAARRRVDTKVLTLPASARRWTLTPSDQLSAGMTLLVEAGDTIPIDGEVIDGVASVDVSAITGESAPVI